jgi:hypothetical protein
MGMTGTIDATARALLASSDCLQPAQLGQDRTFCRLVADADFGPRPWLRDEQRPKPMGIPRAWRMRIMPTRFRPIAQSSAKPRRTSLCVRLGGACVALAAASCDSAARAPAPADAPPAATSGAQPMPPSAPREAGSVDQAFADPISQQEAACGVGPGDQVGSGRKITVISPARRDIDAVLTCLLENRSYALVNQHAGALLVEGRYSEGLAWNRRLAEKVLEEHGASPSSPPEQLTDVPLAPFVADVARRFVRIFEADSRLVPSSEAEKWRAVLESQDRQALQNSTPAGSNRQ